MTDVPPPPLTPDSPEFAAAVPQGPTPPPAPPTAGAPVPPSAVAEVRSPLSDGEWHRLHPLTPVLRGGVFLLVVIGIVIANLRDRIIGWFFPQGAEWSSPEGEAIDYIFGNELIIVALLVVLALLLVVVLVFWMSWRFHTFRITGDDVEVRSGIFFRTHRRAPLDRVQGVNLTRPMIARLLGTAKLEVVGAGLDANVKLEYLSTSNAEAVRADILRLASGRQLARASAAADAATTPRARAAAAAVSAGLTGLIDGAEQPVDEPASVVHIPTGRLIGSYLLSDSTLWMLLLVAAVVVGSIVGTPWVLFTIIPALIGFGTYWFRAITRSLRYSIAPTPSGVRITFGLFTTVTEILPPGRVHAFEIRQPLMWRGFGWWTIRVNRLSGRAATDTQSLQFADVLPVGTREDVERVMRLFLPDISPQQWRQLVEHGLLGPRRAGDEVVEDAEVEAEAVAGADLESVEIAMDAAVATVEADPFTTTPRRARWLRPLSWRRNGFLLAGDALLLRRGRIQRSLVLLPLARLQSIRISQGPIDRAARVANITGHTVLGQVSGALGIIDRDDAYALWLDAAHGVVTAVADDRSHRWDSGDAFEEADGYAQVEGEVEARDAVAEAAPVVVADPSAAVSAPPAAVTEAAAAVSAPPAAVTAPPAAEAALPAAVTAPPAAVTDPPAASDMSASVIERDSNS